MIGTHPTIFLRDLMDRLSVVVRARWRTVATLRAGAIAADFQAGSSPLPATTSETMMTILCDHWPSSAARRPRLGRGLIGEPRRAIPHPDRNRPARACP